MFKRIILALTFAATLGGASLLMTDNAEARRWVVGRPYASSYYYGPRYYAPRVYTYGVPYNAYYGGYYGPRVYSYGYPGAYYYGPGVRVGVGIGRFWW